MTVEEKARRLFQEAAARGDKAFGHNAKEWEQIPEWLKNQWRSHAATVSDDIDMVEARRVVEVVNGATETIVGPMS